MGGIYFRPWFTPLGNATTFTQIMLSLQEVRQHNTKEDCWVVIHDKAYDVTDFVDQHPGGAQVILKYAGKDATKAFDPIHPSDTLTKYLPSELHLGEVEKRKERAPQAPVPTLVNTEVSTSHEYVDEFDVEYDEQADKLSLFTIDKPESPPSESDDDEADGISEERASLIARMPPLLQIYNLADFEYVARRTMEPLAWAYYSSGCEDELTMRHNHSAYHSIFFKPRVLVDVLDIDLSTTMLGTKVLVPIYITATALGKLGHPDGEKVLTRSASKQGIIQMIPTLASCSFDEIVDEAVDNQTQWLQLYVNSDREISRKIIAHAEERGLTALFITVDAPQLGRREKDMRSKKVEDLSHVQDKDDAKVDRSQGAARAISSFIDPSLLWKDIAWFKSVTKMKIVLKGVQCVEDAVLAAQHGVDGIVLSNHGGRQLEFLRPPIEILPATIEALRKNGFGPEFEVYVDGGIRRATDILKALCLGAKGVGIGRPFLYAMSTYGDDGVIKAIQLLKDEMVMDMRLLGVTNTNDLNEKYIDQRNLGATGVPQDRMTDDLYEPLQAPSFMQ